MTVGLMMQLNWVEEEASRWALLTTGLQNTFLDVFMTQHQKTANTSDPGTASAFNFGGGVRIEF
jgi:hypothetical protein